MKKDITSSSIKAYLVGYPVSQDIVPASRYLVEKYLPFETTFINYEGNVKSWSAFIADYFRQLDDEYVIFALDDYLISHPLDERAFAYALNSVDEQTVCIKLCDCSEKDHQDYPVTTQWCLWNREYLISILDRTGDPWSFEMTGSNLHKEGGKVSLNIPCIRYDPHSCLSSRWVGVKVDGLKEEDINYIEKNELIKNISSNGGEWVFRG